MDADQVLATLGDIDVELALGADQATSPLSWQWTKLAPFTHQAAGTTGAVAVLRPRVLGDAIKITKGNRDESTSATTSSVELELDNSDGTLTVGNAMSAMSPDFDIGTPLRIVLPGTGSYLLTDGDLANNVSTPDTAALDIVGDLRLRFEGDIDWFSGDFGSGGLDKNPALIGKYKATSDERSFLFWASEGYVRFGWTPDGTTFNNVTSTVPFPWTHGHHAVEVFIDVSNGGNHVVTFRVADTNAGPWTTLYSETRSGVTSIFSSTAPLEVGVVTGESSQPHSGHTIAAEVYNSASTLVAHPNFAIQAPGTTSFTDSTGKVWTLNGDAEITDRHVEFSGQIDDLTYDWIYDAPVEARVKVTASGELRRTAQGDEGLESAIFRAAMGPANQPGILGYWPFEDPDGAIAAGSPIPGVKPAFIGPAEGAWRFAGDSTLPASKPLVNVPAGEGCGWKVNIPRRTVTDWTLTEFFKVESASASPMVILDIASSGTVAQTIIDLTSSALRTRSFDRTGAEIVALSEAFAPASNEVFDGWTQLFIQYYQNGANLHRVFGWLSINGTAFGSDVSTAGTVASPRTAGALFSAPPDGFSFGQVVVTTGVGAGFLGWTAGANAAYEGEPAARRYARLCGEQGARVRIYGDPANSERMGPQPYDRGFLELLDDCAAADMGLQSDAHPDWPGFTYRTRASMYNQSPAVTLDRDARELVEPYEPVRDDQRRRTDVTVNRPQGAMARFTVPANAPYVESLSVGVATDLQLDDQAAWRVHRGTIAALRYPSLTTDLVLAPQRVEEVRTLIQGDLVRGRNTPGVNPADNTDILAEGFEVNLGAEGWTCQINGGPADPFVVAVLDSDTLGKLDTWSSTLNSSATTTATSLSVASVAGSLWDPADAEDGFDIDIGGERMTVTDISGASSPQTFTVVRSVNGVVKAHSSGAAVQLWHDAVLAL